MEYDDVSPIGSPPPTPPRVEQPYEPTSPQSEGIRRYALNLPMTADLISRGVINERPLYDDHIYEDMPSVQRLLPGYDGHDDVILYNRDQGDNFNYTEDLDDFFHHVIHYGHPYNNNTSLADTHTDGEFRWQMPVREVDRILGDNIQQWMTDMNVELPGARRTGRYNTRQMFKTIRNNQRSLDSVGSRRPTSQLLRELPPKFV